MARTTSVKNNAPAPFDIDLAIFRMECGLDNASYVDPIEEDFEVLDFDALDAMLDTIPEDVLADPLKLLGWLETQA